MRSAPLVCLHKRARGRAGGSVNGLENHLFVIALVIDILGQSNHIAEEEERIHAAIAAAHWTTTQIHNILTHQQMLLQKCYFRQLYIVGSSTLFFDHFCTWLCEEKWSSAILSQ